MKTKAILVATLIAGSSAYASGPVRCPATEPRCPKPKTSGELIEVTGDRIPGFTEVSMDSIELKNIKATGGSGGPAAAEAVNEGGKAKAEKAKNESATGQSTWWTSLSAWAFKVLKVASWEANGYLDFKGTKKPNGEEVIELNACFDISRGSQNKDNCSKTEVYRMKDGNYFVAFHKLVIRKDSRGYERLVYSTEDSIKFIVRDEQELMDLLLQIDPTL